MNSGELDELSVLVLAACLVLAYTCRGLSKAISSELEARENTTFTQHV